MLRKIIHIDMDMFYAAIEMRDNSRLKNVPLVVGGKPNTRSVVCTANYIARKFGIRAGMSCHEAYKRCPQVVFVNPHFEKYEIASNEIREIFHDYTDLVEPMSLDEAYLDVTNNNEFASKIAKEIKQRIFEKTKLTASAGVSVNKMLAKIASDYKKPNGLTVIRPEDIEAFLDPLDINKIPFIGKVTAKKLNDFQIFKVSDLKLQTLEFLAEEFGKFGQYLYNASRGIDESPVVTDYERKSYGKEDTFSEDILDKNIILDYLEDISLKVFQDVDDEGIAPKTVTLKLKYFDFVSVTRSFTFDTPIRSSSAIFEIVKLLIERTEAGKKKIRLAGISLSNFDEERQMYFPFYYT